MRTLFTSIAVFSASVACVAWQAMAGATARVGSGERANAAPVQAATTRDLAPPTAAPTVPARAQALPATAPTLPARAPTLPATPTGPTPAQATPTAAPTRPASSPVVPTRAPVVAAPIGTPRDGTYASDVIPTNWGGIQVELVVENGRISDVTSLQYPRSRSRSLQISRNSLPVYAEQVVATQGARVNSITGATQTARGFQQAVQSAMRKAS